MLTLTTASAGSGKTYLLAQEYIRLALNPDNPLAFRGILAVTFTKKATAEIKTRILEQLKEMALGQIPLPVLSARHTPELAAHVHKKILEHYDDFAVLTLDSFFQQIVRSFAIELDLPGSYKIQIDTDEVKDLALDRLLGREAAKPDVQPLLQRMVEDQLEDGGKWSIKSRLSGFADQLFKTSFARHAEQLEHQHGNITLELLTSIRKEGKDLDTALESICHSAHALMLTLGDVSGLNKVTRKGMDKMFSKPDWGMFDKDSKYVAALRDSPFEVTTYFNALKANEVPDAEAYTMAIGEAITQIVAYVLANQERYNTLYLLEKRLKETLLMTELAHEVQHVRAENNLFLLYQQAMFLSRITAESSAPFIYMKAGLRLRHFLIDEMQDTSREQWEALLPLLVNSLGESHDSLVVGDVKQAIYRWRGGDATLMLSGIEDDLTGNIKRDSLSFNYRSLGKIIEFNNLVVDDFPQLAQNAFLAQTDTLTENLRAWLTAKSHVLLSSYTGGRQKLPKAKESSADLGLVRLEFMANSKAKSGDAEDEEEASIQQKRILGWITEAKELGYTAGEICILVRSAKEGGVVAEYLLNAQAEGNSFCQFSSTDSLKLSSAGTVRFLIATLRVLGSPKDTLSMLEALGGFCDAMGKTGVLTSIMDPSFTRTEDPLAAFWGYLPEDVRLVWDRLPYLTPFEIVMELVSAANLQQATHEAAFLTAFIDEVQKFDIETGGSIEAFLLFWDRKDEKLKIQLPPAEDRIQILTIHKSKGLEFPIVLVPFVEWPLNSTRMSEILWLEMPDPEAYFRIQLAAFDYSSTLFASELKPQAYMEQLNQTLDALNVAYVAFTRASRMLYLGAKVPSDAFIKEPTSAKYIHELLYQWVLNQQESRLADEVEGVTSYQWGKAIGPDRAKQKSATDTIYPALFFPKQRRIEICAEENTAPLSVGDDNGLLGHIFRTAHANGLPNTDATYTLLRDGLVSKPQLKELLTTFASLSQLPNAAKLWYVETKSKLHLAYTLLTPLGSELTIDRVLTTPDGMVLTQIVVNDKEADLQSALEQLREIRTLLSDMGRKVAGAYVVVIEPFAVHTLEKEG